MHAVTDTCQVGVSMVRLTFAQIFQFGALKKVIRSEAAATTR
jgi:hypothetical protein